jgi:hypothetical protein
LEKRLQNAGLARDSGAAPVWRLQHGDASLEVQASSPITDLDLIDDERSRLFFLAKPLNSEAATPRQLPF